MYDGKGKAGGCKKKRNVNIKENDKPIVKRGTKTTHPDTDTTEGKIEENKLNLQTSNQKQNLKN